ncbi:relaxase domain-containing protein [Escherichia coli]|nr:relaxase domain-containing protein [Escherichia coli]
MVANVTQHNGEWKTLSSDKVGKPDFPRTCSRTGLRSGKIYQSELRQRVEALGYETEVVGKHGMWEMPGVPVEAFSGRSQAIREAVGEDASLKSGMWRHWIRVNPNSTSILKSEWLNGCRR